MGHHKEGHHGEPDYKVGRKLEVAGQAEQTPESEKRPTDEMEEIRSRREDLRVRLLELRHASNDAWAELKTGVENAFDELRGSVQKVVNRFEAALRSPEEQSKGQSKRRNGTTA